MRCARGAENKRETRDPRREMRRTTCVALPSPINAVSFIHLDRLYESSWQFQKAESRAARRAGRSFSGRPRRATPGCGHGCGPMLMPMLWPRALSWAERRGTHRARHGARPETARPVPSARHSTSLCSERAACIARLLFISTRTRIQRRRHLPRHRSCCYKVISAVAAARTARLKARPLERLLSGS